MRTTDTTEAGLESLIVASLTGQPLTAGDLDDAAHETQAAFTTSDRYVLGDPKDYDRSHAVDLAKLLDFLQATQPHVVESLPLDQDGPKRQPFLHRLQGEIAKYGVIEVLRKGIRHGPVSVDLFYGSPTPGNTKAEERFRANIFSVTRQLRYSQDETKLALDLCVFINGLPIPTFEELQRTEEAATGLSPFPPIGRSPQTAGDGRGQDYPHHGVAQDAPQRELLRVHRDSEEQDAGDVRRPAAGRHFPAVPRVHHEAGHPGSLYPGRTEVLHAGRELLPPDQGGRRRSRVRHEEGTEEAES